MRRILPIALLLFVVVGCHKKLMNPPPTASQGEGRFLSIPFSRGTEYRVLQGWIYSAREQAIYHAQDHMAIDFATRRGTPVLAAADGLALATYQCEPGGTYKGKRVGKGLGLFVQVWHPERQVFTMYGHLSAVAKEIPYYKPEIHGEYYEPVIVYRPGDQISSVQTKTVRRGEVIGSVGDTGCYWGYKETPGQRPDPQKYPSLDGPNLHYQVYKRGSSGKIDSWYDPFGIYGKAVEYQNPTLPDTSLWLLGREGLPLLADEPAP